MHQQKTGITMSFKFSGFRITTVEKHTNNYDSVIETQDKPPDSYLKNNHKRL